VNDYCEFPEDLDMEPYTQEGLTRMDLQREYENAIKEGKETDIKVPEKLHSDEYY